MKPAFLQAIQKIIQEDAGKRGLRTDPASNLITATAADFSRACASVAQVPNPVLAIVTGFYIPTADPPAGETDGPLGALFLARALVPIGVRVIVATDAFCTKALQAGLAACGLQDEVDLITLPSHDVAQSVGADQYCEAFFRAAGPVTHLLALERVGPNHTLASLKDQLGGEGMGETALRFLEQVSEEHQDRCHTMRGRDITMNMSPAHWLFEGRLFPTIGIGDGGNEIGMGRIAWDVIERNIPNGGLVACRVPTDALVVCGISNWGAYGLAAGVRLLRGHKLDGQLFDPEEERRLLQVMVEAGPLVDGVSGRPTVSVDGLSFERYAEVLPKLSAIK